MKLASIALAIAVGLALPAMAEGPADSPHFDEIHKQVEQAKRHAEKMQHEHARLTRELETLRMENRALKQQIRQLRTKPGRLAGGVMEKAGLLE